MLPIVFLSASLSGNHAGNRDFFFSQSISNLAPLAQPTGYTLKMTMICSCKIQGRLF